MSEFGFINSLKKLSKPKTFDIVVGEDTYTFRILTAADQIQLTSKVSEKYDVVKDRVSFLVDLKLNSLIYGMHAINGEKIPKLDTTIADDEGNTSTVFDCMREILLNWSDAVFNYVSLLVEKEQSELYNSMYKDLGINIDTVASESPFDYKQELDRIVAEDEEFVKSVSGEEEESTEVTPSSKLEREIPQEETPLEKSVVEQPKEEAPLMSQEEYMRQNTKQNSGYKLSSTKPTPLKKVEDNPEEFAKHMEDVARKAPKIKR